MASRSSVVFVGIKGTVVAIVRETGDSLWSTELKGSDFVNVVVQDGDLYASSKGRLYRLDPTTGKILWHNELPGLGYGLVTIAGAGQAPPAESKRRADAAAAAAATTAAT